MVNHRSLAQPASNGVGRRESIVQFTFEIGQDRQVLLPSELGIDFPQSLNQNLRRWLLPLLFLQFPEQVPQRAASWRFAASAASNLDLPEPRFLKDSQVFGPDRVVRSSVASLRSRRSAS